MSHGQEKAGSGWEAPAGKENTVGNGAEASIGNLAAIGFDNWHAEQTAQRAAACGQANGTPAPVIAAPAAPQPERWAGIPQELRERPQWCVAREDKAPLTAIGRAASTTAPNTWTDFDTTCRAAAAKCLHIGFVLHENDEFTCIDLDVKDADNEPDPSKHTSQEQLDRYWRIVQSFDSYTELSRSGKGLHIWIRGKVGAGCKRDGVEVYSQQRFIICTGNVLLDKPVENRQQMLEMLVADIRRATSDAQIELVEEDAAITDDELWSRATVADNSEKFMQLWRGDWKGLGYPSQSEADLSLLSMLCFYSRSNEQVRRIFRMSELGKRAKARKNNVYIDRTLVMIRSRQVREEAQVAHGREVAGSLMTDTNVDGIHGFAIPTPKLRQEAYYGILREIADSGSAQSEAVPAALAINTLGRFCATVGIRPYITIGDDWRSLRPFALIVGPTSKGRKGTSAQLPNRIFGLVERLLGLHLAYETSVSSGEGLVWMVRDATFNSEGEVQDPGVTDKRVLLEVSEFSGVLAQAKRESSVLTSVLRDAWDGRRLSTPNKNNPCTATDAHFVVLGHITREELTKLLTNTDIKNGFANRFMMVYSARERIVDDPQPTSESVQQSFAQRIADAVKYAWARVNEPVKFSPSAKERWILIRRELDGRSRTTDVESLMARADTYVRILAAAIALINQEEEITPNHLDAALAWVNHWEDTANFCFTAAAQYDEMVQSKTIADEIVEAVRKRGGKDVPRATIYDELTNRGKRKDRNKNTLEKAITALQNEAPPRIVINKTLGKGRPTNTFSLAT